MRGSACDEPYIIATTGISNTAAQLNVAVYPTVCSSQLFADSKEAGVSYRIQSATGALVREGMLQAGHNTIETSNLAAGMYILMLNNADNKKDYRFVRQ